MLPWQGLTEPKELLYDIKISHTEFKIMLHRL